MIGCGKQRYVPSPIIYPGPDASLLALSMVTLNENRDLKR